MWGLISIILLWKGIKRDSIAMLISAGVFAIASVLSWYL